MPGQPRPPHLLKGWHHAAEVGSADDEPEGANDVVPVHLGADASAEHERVGRQLVIKCGSMGGEGVDDRVAPGNLSARNWSVAR